MSVDTNQQDKQNATEQEVVMDMNTPETIGEEMTAPAEEQEVVEDEMTLLQKENAALQAKFEALQSDYLRLMADFDNFRKRTLREKAELLKNGGEDVLKKILPVVDDFERAMQAMSAAQDVEAMKEGVALIYTKFQAYLTSNGVTEIPANGEVFDTEIHEAITTFPAPTPEQKGMVIDCMTKGYKLHDKVIRFAKVVVGE